MSDATSCRRRSEVASSRRSGSDRPRISRPAACRGRRWRWSRQLIAATSLLAVVLSACGSGEDAGEPASAEQDTAFEDGALDTPASTESGTSWRTGGTTDAAVDDAAERGDGPVPADGDDAAEPGDGPADGDDTATAAGGDTPRPVSVTTGRRVIRTAELVLEVDDPAEAAEEVVDVASRAGGFVAETDLERDAEGIVSGTITLRVPTAALLETVTALDGLAAAVPVRRIDERDVTAEATDLEARLTNLTTYEGELRALLRDVRETTERPEDLLTVFERIRAVREEIDRIDAQLSVLSDQVALSTIRVSLVPAAQALPVADPTWAPGSTVREALTATARALTGLADVVIWLTLTVVPVLASTVLPLVVVTAVALRWWRRRDTGPRDRGPDHGGTPTPPAGPAPTPPAGPAPTPPAGPVPTSSPPGTSTA